MSKGFQAMEHFLPRRADPLMWLMVSLVLVILPHALRMPVWVGLLCMALGSWRLLASYHHYPLPRKWVLMMMTFLAVVGVLASYRTLFGRDAGAALLIVMLALKLLEMKSLRDSMVVVFLSYFLVIINFFYSQSIPTALYMFIIVLLITATLISLNHPGSEQQIGPKLRLATILLAQAIPLMLVLFVLFPRVSGPLWGIPKDAYSGKSGLSNEMTPGSISTLSLSAAVAFRVEFTDGMATAVQRYWRGPVFWDFDGRTWSTGAPLPVTLQGFEVSSEPLHYIVTLEPHERNWLFALDMPASGPPHSHITADFQFHSSNPVRQRLRYEMTSYLHYRIGRALSEVERKRALQIPYGNPEALALTGRWKQEGLSDAEIAQRGLSLFRTQAFTYTLNPPPLGEHPIDDFLFHTRRGFCEHFSSSYAVLMRMAGIPARIVTGYQGGEFNPLGNYLIVRQADAHAWVEIWLAGEGWVRIDPTAAVAPQRVEIGLNAALPTTEITSGLIQINSNWLHQTHLAWDSLNNNWNQWVLAYGPQRQQDLFFRLGLGGISWQWLTAGLVTLCGGLLLAFALFMLHEGQRKSHDRVLELYQTFCGKLKPLGLVREPFEGPLDFAARVVTFHPELKTRVDIITQLYVDLRYGSKPSDMQYRYLKQHIRSFQPA